MYPRRPIIVSGPGDTVYRRSSFWLIDGTIFPKSAGKGGFLLGTPTEPGQRETTPDVRARELLDIAGRLQAMDMMGVETQVVYPTLFLAYLTDDVTLEVALCRSYNRFMAGVWEQARGRLRWVVVPPLRSIDASIEELNFAKEHGAVGLFFRGIERDRTLDDPYFFPVYQEAARLNMPVCVHTGAGCPAFSAIFDVTRSHTFPHTRTLPLMAFRNLVANKIPGALSRATIRLHRGGGVLGALRAPRTEERLRGESGRVGTEALRGVPSLHDLRGVGGPAVPGEVRGGESLARRVRLGPPRRPRAGRRPIRAT